MVLALRNVVDLEVQEAEHASQMVAATALAVVTMANGFDQHTAESTAELPFLQASKSIDHSCPPSLSCSSPYRTGTLVA